MPRSAEGTADPAARSHQPHDLAGICAVSKLWPALPLLAYFDAALCVRLDQPTKELHGPHLRSGQHSEMLVVARDEEATIAQHCRALAG